MHRWQIAESPAIDKLVKTYAFYFQEKHNMEYTEALVFVYEIVMVLIDYILVKPTGGERMSVAGKEIYSATISPPDHPGLRFLFREVSFGWTIDYENKRIVLEWFKLAPR